MKYVCSVCGWEYDEEQMPENPRNKRSPLGDDE